MAWGSSESESRYDSRVEEYGQILAGTGDRNRDRLQALFEEKDDPRADEIFKAWGGLTNLRTPEEAAKRTNRTDVVGFDPAEDAAISSDKINVKSAYDRAIEADMEHEAALLRTATISIQNKFATFLKKGEFLPRE